MEGLIITEMPEPKLLTMIVAFSGWPDAAESATRAVRYIVRKLPAKKFAEIDPEEFYDFTIVRSQTRVNRRGERIIRWPTNDFYYVSDPAHQSRGLVLYIGTEPNLRWRAFSNIITGVAEQCGVQSVVSLGAMLDAVPHTREPRVTGRASSTDLTQKVEWMGIRNSGYQGPTGIHTSFAEVCNKRGPCACQHMGALSPLREHIAESQGQLRPSDQAPEPGRHRPGPGRDAPVSRGL